LHGLLLEVLEFPVPVLVAVQGQCLGGGLELALACSRIFAAPGAHFGQPEIKLGVFAPAASVLLPYRVNQPTAEDLLFSGRSIGAHEAHRLGLVQVVDEDPVASALAYFEEHLQARSAAALACATVAVRGAMQREVRARLAEVEKLYLEWLMKTHDANEGLAAFLQKRQPEWTHQ
jgi:cyclohexa-1,5-dienecarbonyl-CoA hydratase